MEYNIGNHHVGTRIIPPSRRKYTHQTQSTILAHVPELFYARAGLPLHRPSCPPSNVHTGLAAASMRSSARYKCLQQNPLTYPIRWRFLAWLICLHMAWSWRLAYARPRLESWQRRCTTKAHMRCITCCGSPWGLSSRQ